MSQADFTQGFWALQEGRFNEAIEAFQTVLTKRPDFAEAHYNLGNVYTGCGDYQQALTAYKMK